MEAFAAMEIQRAETKDLDQLLEAQRLAYRDQALLVNDLLIPPLVETVADIERDFPVLVILKAVVGGRLAGSVRGRPEGDTCHGGRLFVLPQYRSGGIGTRLLREIEAACPKDRYELFTSDRSIDNIRLYEREGYVLFRETDHPAGYRLVYLEKRPTHER
jgi:GNAT superfamily N-acetyltransferase